MNTELASNSGEPDPTIPINALNTLSPIDGRYWEQAEALSPYFSEGALIRARVEIEARYLIAVTDALSEAKNADGSPAARKLDQNERDTLLQLAPNLTSDQLGHIKQIEDTTQHD